MELSTHERLFSFGDVSLVIQDKAVHHAPGGEPLKVAVASIHTDLAEPCTQNQQGLVQDKKATFKRQLNREIPDEARAAACMT